MGKPEYSSASGTIKQLISENFVINPIKEVGDAFSNDINEWFNGLEDKYKEPEDGLKRFRKALKPDFLESREVQENVIQKAKEKGYSDLELNDYFPKEQIANLYTFLETPTGYGNIKYDDWNKRFGNNIDSAILGLDNFNELTNYKYVTNPEMTALKYALNKMAEQRTLIETYQNLEFSQEEKEEITKFTTEKEALVSERIELEGSFRENDISYSDLENNRKSIVDEMQSNQEHIDALKSEVAVIENDKKKKLKELKSLNNSFDKLTNEAEKQKKEIEALESEDKKQINSAGDLMAAKSQMRIKDNISEECSHVLDTQAGVKQYFINKKINSVNEMDLSDEFVRNNFISDIVRLNPEGKQFSDRQESDDYRKELQLLGESQLKQRINGALDNIKIKADEYAKQYPEYQKLAIEYTEKVNMRTASAGKLNRLKQENKLVLEEIKRIAEAYPGYTQLEEKLTDKKDKLARSENLMNEQKEFAGKMEALSKKCVDFIRKENAFKDKYKSFAGSMAHNANNKNQFEKAATRFTVLKAQLNKCKRAGHSNTEEFTALDEALNNITNGENVKEKLLEIKQKADEYLKKKKGGLHLNTQMRRQRLDTAKAISQLAGSLLKGEEIANNSEYKKAADKINGAIEKPQIDILSKNVSKGVQNRQKDILSEEMTNLLRENLDLVNPEVKKKPLAAGLQ